MKIEMRTRIYLLAEIAKNMSKLEQKNIYLSTFPTICSNLAANRVKHKLFSWYYMYIYMISLESFLSCSHNFSM